MKPNHLLSRLRQDLRKMASAPDEIGYSRYRKYTTNKLKRLREMLHANEMKPVDIDAFKDCVAVFSEVIALHDGKA